MVVELHQEWAAINGATSFSSVFDLTKQMFQKDLIIEVNQTGMGVIDLAALFVIDVCILLFSFSSLFWTLATKMLRLHKGL